MGRGSLATGGTAASIPETGVAERGAKVIAFDVLFTEAKPDPREDRALAEAIRVGDADAALEVLAAGGDHVVALLEGVEHGGVLLPRLRLRPQDQEVEHRADQADLQEEDGHAAARTGSRGHQGQSVHYDSPFMW